MKLQNYVGYNKPKLGLHWVPSPYHAHANNLWVLDKCQKMNMGYVTIIDDGGGSTMEVAPWYPNGIIDEILKRNIIPVVRFFAPANAKFDSRMEGTAKLLVDRGVKYIFWQNEPEVGSVEWQNRPKNWVQVITANYVDGAYKIIKIGGYPGMWATTTWQYPDENGNPVNPWTKYMTEQQRKDIFIDGPGWIAIHNYSKNHPIDYPFDPVNVEGKKMTHDEYQYWLNQVDEQYRNTQHLWVFDDYQTSEHHINFLRSPHPDANLTDDVCFNMYQGIQNLMKEAGILIPIISTECGPCVGERDDGRYPRVTPQTQITMVDQEITVINSINNYFSMCFWLAGVQRLNTVTADSFEDQSWWTDRHNDPFKLAGEMPIVQYLINKNEGGQDNMPSNQKLGAHFQIGDVNTLNKLPNNLPIVKSMDLNAGFSAELKAKFPNALRVCRIYVDNQDRYKTDPQNLVDEIVNKFSPVAQYYTAIETGNEIINNSSSIEDAKAFDKYQVLLANTIWNKWPSMKVVGFNFATGNLGVGNELNLSNFPYSMQLPTDKFYVGCHSYSWERMSTSAEYYTLRYRKLAEGHTDHKFVITECGVTNAVIQGKPDVGWRTHGKEAQFIEDLIWFNSEIVKDHYVVGATVFNCGPSFGWDTFESTEQLTKAVNIISNQSPPMYETPIRVKIGDSVVTMELENYLRSVVPAEMPPSYNREALIAQTIVARTYAMHMISHPRSKDFDIYSDARDQVFDPSKEHAITNDIIRETKGQIILGVIGQYVKRCGLKRCPLCNGQNGTNGVMWEGRMCQDGANEMAKNGNTSKQIIKHFYFYEENIPEDDQSNQAKAYGVEVKLPNGIKPDDWYFKAINIRHLPQEENNGNHHIYVDVLEKEGLRIYGSQVSVQDSFNNVDTATVEKPLSEPGGNVAMWGHETNPPNKRTVYVSQPNIPSEVVTGIHPAWPDEPPGNTLFHHSFSIIFKLVRYSSVVEEPDTPVIEIDEMRNILWNNTKLGIPYNPDAAFPKKARELKLGAPLTYEIEYKDQVLQGYALGWLYCTKGDWGNIKQEGW